MTQYILTLIARDQPVGDTTTQTRILIPLETYTKRKDQIDRALQAEENSVAQYHAVRELCGELLTPPVAKAPSYGPQRTPIGVTVWKQTEGALHDLKDEASIITWVNETGECEQRFADGKVTRGVLPLPKKPVCTLYAA